MTHESNSKDEDIKYPAMGVKSHTELKINYGTEAENVFNLDK